MIEDKWDIRFLHMAKEISTWSKDPSTSVGAIAIDDDKRVLSMGFNGFPRGIADTHERLYNKEEKYQHIVHAEANVVYNATYHGVSLHGATVYVHGLMVCSECAKALIQVGVKRVVMKLNGPFDLVPTKWKVSWEDTKQMFDEVGIEWEIK